MSDSDWRKYFYSDAQLVTCAVSVKFDGLAEFIGSAVYLAPALFVTAKHVIEDPISRVGLMREVYENKKFGQLDTSLSTKDFILETVQFPKIEAQIAQRWNINKMHFSHDYDFAVMIADFTDGPLNDLIATLPTTSINIHPVPRRNTVVSCGFFGTSEQIDESTVEHTISFTGRPGKLINLHLDHASVAGSAVYEINNKIEHMMSGGPVFNHAGSVMAVNSSGLYGEDGSSDNRTIATPFIRGMLIEFEYIINGKPTKTSLYELAQKGVIEVIGFEHLSWTDSNIVWTPSLSCAYCHPPKN